MSSSEVRMASKVSRDWSELPPELIERIAGTLDSIPDYVIFGAVCKSWRSAARSMSPPHQSPWLYSVDYSADRLQLHDPWKPGGIQSTYTFRIPLPLDHKKYEIYGSAYGYLLVYDRIMGLVSLFNPLLPEGSSSWFALPPLPIAPFPLGQFGHVIGITSLQLLKYGDSSYCVIFTSIMKYTPFCWRPGDTSWIKLYEDFVYHYTFYKGSFYILDFTGQVVVVVDVSNLTVTSRFAIPELGEGWSKYLVESSSGELLVLAIDTRGNLQHRVIRVDLSQKPHVFVKVRSIGEDALFVVSHHMASHHSVICYSVTKSKGLKRNCIYYYDGRRGGQCRLYSLDIGDGSIKAESFVNEEGVNWHVPALSSILE